MNDQDMWQEILDGKHKDAILLLDTDETMLSFPNGNFYTFEHTIGNNPGVFDLFDVLGINNIEMV